MTYGIISNYLETKILNHLLRNTTYTATANVWVALFTSAPSDWSAGVEVSGGSYARQQAPAFTVYSTAVATFSSTVTFPTATADWGTITGIGIMNASSSGSQLFIGELNYPQLIKTGETASISAGTAGFWIDLQGHNDPDDIKKGGWSDIYGQGILNHVLNNIPLSSPGTDVWLGLGKDIVLNADYNFVSWTEVSETGYSRKQIYGTGWTYPSSIGKVYNVNDIIFSAPPIAANWGRITHFAIFDASVGGDVIFWGTINPSIYIIIGDGLMFNSFNIAITLD